MLVDHAVEARVGPDVAHVVLALTPERALPATRKALARVARHLVAHALHGVRHRVPVASVVAPGPVVLACSSCPASPQAIATLARLNGGRWIDLVFANGDGYDKADANSDLLQQTFRDEGGLATTDIRAVIVPSPCLPAICPR